MAKILLVDSDPPRRRSVARRLRAARFEVDEAVLGDAVASVGRCRYACVVVSDHRSIAEEESVQMLRVASDASPVVIVDGDADVVAVVAALVQVGSIP